MTTLRNIIILITTFILATACSSDILEDNSSNNADNGNIEVEGATFSIRLTDGATQTKATGDSVLLDDDEKTIETLVIAVFEQATHARVGLKVLNAEQLASCKQADGSYVVTDIPSKEGKMKVVAAANVRANLFDGIYTDATPEYSQLSVEGITPDALVKVNNGVEVTLKQGEVENVNMALTQLPARVDIVNITIKDEPLAKYVMDTMSATANTKMYVFNAYSWANTTPEAVPFVQRADIAGSFYTYPVAALNEKGKHNISVSVEGAIHMTKDGGDFVKAANFSFNIEQDLISGKLYRANVVVNSNLDLIKVTFTVLDWEEHNIEVGLN